MARESFKIFNEKRRQEYERDTGVRVPPAEELAGDRSAFEERQRPETVSLGEGLTLKKDSVLLGSDG